MGLFSKDDNAGPVKKRRGDPMAGIRSPSPAKTVKPANAGSSPASTPKEAPPPKPPPAGRVLTYFDSLTGSYYAQNGHGEYQRWDKDTLKLLLRRNAFSTTHKYEDGLTYLEGELLRITQESSVHYAGPLGGYEPGEYEIFTSRILVTRGPKLLTPKEGKCETISNFLTVLLGDQRQYFYAWLKTALVSLRRGPPWLPGQLLAVAGPPGCGKSVLQSLVTPLLGGRVSSPYTYLSSGTNFNAEIYGAEHGLIGDVNHAVDPRARRNFGAAIKKLVAEPVHYLHAKGKTPVTMTPFLRLTLSLNDNPAALHILPSFDSDVAGKVMLLRARTDGKRIVDTDGETWQKFYNRMLSELPAFVHRLMRWQIPDKIKDERYSVVSFHDPELIEKVNELSEEDKLLDLIDTYILIDEFKDHWAGTSTELERELGERMSKSGGCNLFRYSSHCGQLLETLSKKHEDRISRERRRSNKWSYLIRKE